MMTQEEFIKKYGTDAMLLLNKSNPRRIDDNYDSSVITYFVHPDYVNPDNYYPVGHERNKYGYDPKSFKGIHFDEGYIEDKKLNLKSPYIPYDDLPDNWKEKFDKEYNRWDRYYNTKKRKQEYDEYFNNPTGITNPADYIGKVTVEKDTDNDGDMDTKITEYK